MKQIVAGFLLLMLPTVANAQPADDPAAVQVLDQMSDVIGDLGSCRFTLQISRDVDEHDVGLVKRFAVDEVYMVGPDKMRIDTRSDNGHKGYWYDGKNISYYSYDENNYATVEAPDTILETIEAVHRDYGVDFPAADFFFPNFTDDLIEGTDRIVFLGKKMVAGKDCFHVMASSKSMGIQLWIADDALNLRVKFCITYHDQPKAPQYEATFSDWQLNPVLPVAMFDFTAPRTAARLVRKRRCER